jgi:xylulokinase
LLLAKFWSFITKVGHGVTYLLGIDIGTSSVKTLVLDADTRRAVSSAQYEYPLYQPQPSYAEQNPDDWWQATVYTVRDAVAHAGVHASTIRGISFSGQMHGGVCLDNSARPLRPAIIWADTRSVSQCNELRRRAETTEIARHASGPPAAGFMATTLMWLTQHEPDTIANTQAFVSPKDYIRLHMTGEVATDVTDAAGTWLLDIASGQWSDWLLDLCRLEPRYLPGILNSSDVAGSLLPSPAEELGLPPGIPVVAGCADQPAVCLAYGLYNPGTVLTAIGTGGQVVHPLASVYTDPQLRFHIMNHAVPQRWYALAAMLSAGLSLRWLRDLLGLNDRPDAYEHLSVLAADVPPGADGLLFLPYLAGERTPHMDSRASGVFMGLRLHHHPGHFARAVMEGVAFAMSECLSLVCGLGECEQPIQVIASGGATRSSVWRQIQADIYGYPLLLSKGDSQACVGAALLAGIGSGVYSSVEDACALLPRPSMEVWPDPAHAEIYQRRNELYRQLYIQLKDPMHRLST